MQNKFTTTLRVILTGLLLGTVLSCEKENPQKSTPTLPGPAMEYFNFNDREIKAGGSSFSFDVNHDGRKDIGFSTLLVGDPINQLDKLRFLVETNIKVNLPVNAAEEIPVMRQGDSVLLNDFDGYSWYELSSIVLVQKVISFTQPPVWEGHWKNAIHKYLPYQVVVADKLYNGWVELTVDIANEKVVLHKAAISKEPNKMIKAGN